MKKLVIFLFCLILFACQRGEVSLYVEYLNHNDTVKYVGKEQCRMCHAEIYDSYMNNNEESLVLFDSINGRIVSTKITGSENLNEIKEFYQHILPNLGWNKTKRNLFIRGDEVLEIIYYKSKGESSVEFNISPK